MPKPQYTVYSKINLDTKQFILKVMCDDPDRSDKEFIDDIRNVIEQLMWHSNQINPSVRSLGLALQREVYVIQNRLRKEELKREEQDAAVVGELAEAVV